MSNWNGKTYGQIAEELKQIDTLEGVIEYEMDLIKSLDEKGLQELAKNNLTPDEWFWDAVRFIDERSQLPEVWWNKTEPEHAK